MTQSKKLIVLLGVLAAACIATFALMKTEEKKEEIANSEEVILEVAADTVDTLAWEYDDISLAFHKDDSGTWIYDGDAAFPVSEEKVNELLRRFEAFGVSFKIEHVEDYAQYGLAEPTCTITFSAGEQSYTILLGAYSKLDEQRYVSIGDGNAYLVSDDPFEDFGIPLEHMIEHDAPLEYDAITRLTFTGAAEYAIDYMEEGAESYCAEDVYFTAQDGKLLPLDTERVDTYLGTIEILYLEDYASYNVTDAELKEYGLDDPELTVTVDYTRAPEEEGGAATAGSYSLSISRSAEERAKNPSLEEGAEEEAEEAAEETTYTAYARVGESQIVYEISSYSFEQLIAAGYDDLRHRELFTADFGEVTSIDVLLDGQGYAFTSTAGESEDEGRAWQYQGTEIEIEDISNALLALSADSFTAEQPAGKEEISLSLQLDNENFPEMQIALYRYDGENCLAVVNGEPTALVPRAELVDLIEAVHAIVLGG